MIQQFASTNAVLIEIVRTVAIAYGIAFAAAFVGRMVLHRLIHLNRVAPRNRVASDQRMRTLQGLMGSLVTFVAFTVATLVTLSILIDTQTILWIFTLFSAAFGLGAQTIVRDLAHGFSFIFRNTFDVDEKVEFELIGVEGIIEEVNLRNTMVRAPSGELYTVPNGEIRVIRNFTRSTFSNASITIVIKTADLRAALAVLEPLGQEAADLFPNLLEPWEVMITSSSQTGRRTELTLIAKAVFSKAAALRPKLLTLVQERLQTANIDLID
ncbi:MAG: mechanosensitive ion channel [Chloroflexi bacterium]|nr:mechanosensitive ion channel [Chloroflexota bacterium]